MVYLLRLTVSLFLLASVGEACTTFSLRDGKSVWMGKSYDWSHDAGMVMINKRNVLKYALLSRPGDLPAIWISQFGSLTFNQHGRDFPLGGINERGLAVEIMWLDSTVFPAWSLRPVVNELQWIQFILDNYSSVEDLIENASEVRVSSIFARVHYMACDDTGTCTTLEFLNGKLVTHSGHFLPVKTLTNDTYRDSLEHLKKFSGFGGSLLWPSGSSSLDRFVNASGRTQKYDPITPAGDYAFETLKMVAQNISKWNIVYNLSERKVSFRTIQSNEIKRVTLEHFDLSCGRCVQVYDMNSPGSGNVETKFVKYSTQLNKRLIKAGIEGFPLPSGALDLLARYPSTTRCLFP